MNKTLIVMIAVLLFSSTVSAAEPKSEARILLDKMCKAMEQTSYQGTFVYLHNNKIESMEIVRRKDERGEIEKILSLNGEAREIIRDDSAVTCILPQSQKVTVDKNRSRSQLPLALPRNLDNIESFYSLSVDGFERVAGLDCDIVTLVPKDGYRYGHRMWIDRSSHLIVKSDLLDEHGQPIEQIMFTALSVNENIPDSAFKPRFNADQYQTIQVGKEKAHESDKGLRWEVTTVPEGFDKVSHDRQKSMTSGEMVEHMIISDGMASVSVFVEAFSDKENTLKGASRMGAINAYGDVKGSYKVTVVGEVPPATVMLINKHIQQVE